MSVATIALGSNLGNRLGNLIKALTFLARDPRVTLQKISSLYRTAPVGAEAQPDFLNAVVQIRTSMTPRELLSCLQSIEKRLGRVRKGRNAPRTVDLDILEHGKAKMRQPDLTVPHPRMLRRKFVLAPLAEIRPRRKSVRSALRTQTVASQCVEPLRLVRLQIKTP